MKKRLRLHRETLRNLGLNTAAMIAGGVETGTCGCSPYTGLQSECDTANTCTTYNPTGTGCGSGNGCNYSGFTCGGTTAYGC